MSPSACKDPSAQPDRLTFDLVFDEITEVAELLGVALLMDGGTASVYAPRAWEAFLEFQQELAPAPGSLS